MDALFSGHFSDAISLIRQTDLTILLTIILIVPAYWSAIISRNTARRQLRAYVSAGMHHEGIVKDEVSGKWVIKFDYQNEGMTPAYKLSIATNHLLTDESDPTLPPVSKPYEIGMVGPQGEIFDSEVTALTDGDIESLAAGRRHLFFFGIIRYLDVFKRSHFTTFRFFAGGTEPFKGASDPDMTLCSKGNEAS
jgi:hypothetical protein